MWFPAAAAALEKLVRDGMTEMREIMRSRDLAVQRHWLGGENWFARGVSYNALLYPIYHRHCYYRARFCSSPLDRKSTRLNSSHSGESRMPSSA